MDVQRTGRIFGWLFIGTFVTSIPARLLFVSGLGASWSDMRFIPGDTSLSSLKLATFLEFGLIVTQIGTAVVLYPVVRRRFPTLGLSYVSARTMESVFAAIGIIAMMSVISLADSLASTDAAAAAVTGNSLVDTYNWAFRWGPGLVAGIGNGLILGYMMYRSELVPRRMAMLGLIGGSLLVVSHVLIVCGAYKDGEPLSGLFTLPEAAWELALGIYCAWKGFNLPARWHANWSSTTTNRSQVDLVAVSGDRQCLPRTADRSHPTVPGFGGAGEGDGHVGLGRAARVAVARSGRL